MAELSDRELLVQIGTRLDSLKEVVSETKQSVHDLDKKMDAMERQMSLVVDIFPGYPLTDRCIRCLFHNGQTP